MSTRDVDDRAWRDLQAGRRLMLEDQMGAHRELWEHLSHGDALDRDLAALLFSEPAKVREAWYKLGYPNRWSWRLAGSPKP